MILVFTALEASWLRIPPPSRISVSPAGHDFAETTTEFLSEFHLKLKMVLIC